MPRQTSKLSAKAISTKPPGRHADGGGLYLLVKPSGGRSWVFRYALGGKRHDLGLGPAGNDPVAVTLAEAKRSILPPSVSQPARHIRQRRHNLPARPSVKLPQNTSRLMKAAGPTGITDTSGGRHSSKLRVLILVICRLPMFGPSMSKPPCFLSGIRRRIPRSERAAGSRPCSATPRL